MKKIIIDGVDVAGCCCYENGKCLWTKRYYENNIVPDCEKVKNCYYKQLQQLKQENEELKKANKKIYNDLHKEICKYDEELSIEKASHKFDLKTLDEYRSTLKKIDKKMELALDVEQTDAEESFDLLYEIQEMIAELLED